MQFQSEQGMFSETLLPGEIAETEVRHVAVAAPFTRSEPLFQDSDIILIFIKGRGKLMMGENRYDINPECIAVPFNVNKIEVRPADKDTVHYLIIKKALSEQDCLELQNFPDKNRSQPYFIRFDDCPAYTEKIKSPNTVSRTVLPKDHIPRVAMGTVEAPGPDEVDAHAHPMLDQLFLGLAGNEVIVHADSLSARLPQFTLLHIPRGSRHGVTVEKGKKMYYQWMDFFITSAGQEWLKTHKPIEKGNDK